MSSSGTHSVAVVSVDGVGDGGDTSRALSQILDTAYNLEFNERTSTSAVRLLVERVKQAFNVRTYLVTCSKISLFSLK